MAQDLKHKIVISKFEQIRKKILVIEDDPDILDLLKIVFRDTGYDVIFSDTEPGTDYIRVLHPDLILLDVRLSGSARSGIQICKDLKSDPETEKLPVILCSGEHNLAEIAKNCNADMYLEKPYDTTNLLFHVNKFLS